MRPFYTNLPYKAKSKTVENFKNYQNQPVTVNPAVLDMTVGFFTSRGFNENSARLIAETVISQAVSDGFNPMQILDTMKSLDKIEISGIVAEILNYSRYKSSSLGIKSSVLSFPEIRRNILA